jgi:hypothetical protein
VKLASAVKAAGTLPGEASLIINTKYAKDNTPFLYFTVNADNGLPIRSEVIPAEDSAQPSKPSVVNYKSSRVTLADVVAGKI